MLKDSGFYKGINLGGWLSQCDYSEERLNSFITEKDFEVIASWGFDHVRLPVDYNVIQDAEGRMMEEGLARIDAALRFCEKTGLSSASTRSGRALLPGMQTNRRCSCSIF